MHSRRVVGVGTAAGAVVAISMGMIGLGPFNGPEQASRSRAESSATQPLEPCQQPASPDPWGDADPLELVLDAGEAARERTPRCATEPAERICRALWLAQQLDPVLVSLRGNPAQARRADALLSWAIGDARSVADPALAAALDELLVGPEDIDAVIDRARPEVLDPLRAAEQAC